MAKRIEGIKIELELSKDEAGEVKVTASAHITLGAVEYPEMQSRKGIPITLTATQETAVKNFAKAVLQGIMTSESAEDGIPIPEPE